MDGSNIKNATTSDSVKSFLKDAGLDFYKCDKYQHKKQKDRKQFLPGYSSPHADKGARK